MSVSTTPLSGDTASGRSGPSIWRRVLYPHSPFGRGLVARLSATHKKAQTVFGPPQSPPRSLEGSGSKPISLTPGTKGETGSPIPIFVLLWARQKLLLISSQPTPVTEPNNPKHAQQQALFYVKPATAPSSITSFSRTRRKRQTTLFPDAIPPYNSIHRMPARCVEPISLSRGAPAPATHSNSTPSGESAQASTSGTVHTHAAETCIGNEPQETSVTITAKTPYPQDLTKDPLAMRT
jgi:hypothetical protein